MHDLDPLYPVRRVLNLLFTTLHSLYSDYAVNEVLDRYSDADINDDEDFNEMTAGQRRAAEAAMKRRDRLERRGGRGARAARRTRYPGFLDSDDMEDEDMDGGILSQMKRRTRRQYDERKDMDDLEGVEDVGFISSGFISSTLLPQRSSAFAGNPVRTAF